MENIKNINKKIFKGLTIPEEEINKIDTIRDELFQDWKKENKDKLDRLYSVLDKNPHVKYHDISAISTLNTIYPVLNELVDGNVKVDIDVYLVLFYYQTSIKICLHSTHYIINMKTLPSYLPLEIREAIMPFFKCEYSDIGVDLDKESSRKVFEHSEVLKRDFIEEHKEQLAIIDKCVKDLEEGEWYIYEDISSARLIKKDMNPVDYSIHFTINLNLKIRSKNSHDEYVVADSFTNSPTILKNHQFPMEYSDELKEAIFSLYDEKNIIDQPIKNADILFFPGIKEITD